MLVRLSMCAESPYSECKRTSSMVTDIDHDPAKEARDARKARVAKNERQHQQNLLKAAQVHSVGGSAAPVGDRKKIIDRTLAVTRSSTASMGKFNRQLEGEKKLKGVKRKVGCLVVRMLGRKSMLMLVSSLSPPKSLPPTKKLIILLSCQDSTRNPH